MMKIIKIIAEILYYFVILACFVLSSSALYEDKKMLSIILAVSAGILIGFRLFSYIYNIYIKR